jgi:hypothetical protein
MTNVMHNSLSCIYLFIFLIFNSLHVLTQFVSPDDEHNVLETCRQLNVKINT